MPRFEIRLSARIDHGGHAIVWCVRKEYDGDSHFTPVSISLGKHRRRALDSPLALHVEGPVDSGQKMGCSTQRNYVCISLIWSIGNTVGLLRGSQETEYYSKKNHAYCFHGDSCTSWSSSGSRHKQADSEPRYEPHVSSRKKAPAFPIVFTPSLKNQRL